MGAILGGRLPRREWIIRILVGAGAFAVGALPWLWANYESRLASLKPSNFPGGAATMLNTGFGGRLSVFFRLALSIEVDLRRLYTGAYVFGGGTNPTAPNALGVAIAAVVFASIAGAVLLCMARGGRWVAIGVAIVAFPLLFAAQPGTWFWNDGRYIVFLGPLLAIAMAAGVDELIRRLARGRVVRPKRTGVMSALVMSSALVAASVLTMAAFDADNQVSLSAIGAGWGDPNGPVDRAIATLEAHGIHDGYADYWVAYKIDLLDHQAMTITPAPGDVDRSAAFDRVVARAAHQAWLFVPPSQLTAGYEQFSGTGVIVGPAAVTEVLFKAALTRMGVPFRTVEAGILHAVVPKRNVTLAQVRQAGG
jgi:hypothetical protein